MADPKIVGGGCGRVAGGHDRAERPKAARGVWVYPLPTGGWVWGGTMPPPIIFFACWTSKWPVSVHCGCRWGCIPIPSGSATDHTCQWPKRKGLPVPNTSSKFSAVSEYFTQNQPKFKLPDVPSRQGRLEDTAIFISTQIFTSFGSAIANKNRKGDTMSLFHLAAVKCWIEHNIIG